MGGNAAPALCSVPVHPDLFFLPSRQTGAPAIVPPPSSPHRSGELPNRGGRTPASAPGQSSALGAGASRCRPRWLPRRSGVARRWHTGGRGCRRAAPSSTLVLGGLRNTHVPMGAAPKGGGGQKSPQIRLCWGGGRRSREASRWLWGAESESGWGVREALGGHAPRSPAGTHVPGGFSPPGVTRARGGQKRPVVAFWSPRGGGGGIMGEF